MTSGPENTEDKKPETQKDNKVSRLSAAGTKGQSSSLLPNQVKADTIFWCGVGIGLFLIFSPPAFQKIGLSYAHDNLLVFCGMGILLGSFGSMAMVQWRGVTIVGAAALAVALSYWFQPAGRVVYGTLAGTEQATNVLFNPQPLIVGRAAEGGPHTFAFLESQLRRSYVSLTLAFPPPGGTPTFCVARADLLRYVANDEVEWIFDRESQRILDIRRDNVPIADATRAVCASRSSFWPQFDFVATALAQSILGDFGRLIGPDLQSRLQARNTLSRNLLPDEVRRQVDVMRSLNEGEQTTPVIRDGIMRAWNLALSDSNQSTQASNSFTSVLSDDDLKFFISLLGSDSPELRASASEFLANFSLMYDRNAPRTTAMLAQAALEEPNSTKSLRSLLLLRNISCISNRRPGVSLQPEALSTLQPLRTTGNQSTLAYIQEIEARSCSNVIRLK